MKFRDWRENAGEVQGATLRRMKPGPYTKAVLTVVAFMLVVIPWHKYLSRSPIIKRKGRFPAVQFNGSADPFTLFDPQTGDIYHPFGVKHTRIPAPGVSASPFNGETDRLNIGRLRTKGGPLDSQKQCQRRPVLLSHNSTPARFCISGNALFLSSPRLRILCSVSRLAAQTTLEAPQSN